MGIALPSRFQAITESIAYQGWKAVNGERIDRDHTGATGIFLARREGPDAGLVHAGSCCGVGTGYGMVSNHHFRSWSGWLRHVWLVMLAFAMMAVIPHQANQPLPPENQATRMPSLRSLGWSRKCALSPTNWTGAASGQPLSSRGPVGEKPIMASHIAPG
jgi:hypothetical protein